MTDKVFPSPDRDMTTKILGQIMEYAGGSDPGWVVPSGTAKIADAARNGFGESHSSTSLDVTIDTGEAFVQGCWIDRDTTTTVTLAASTSNQSVYVGLDLSMKNKVIVGLSSDFASNDPKMEIWSFDTDGSGVTSSTDERYTVPTIQGYKGNDIDTDGDGKVNNADKIDDTHLADITWSDVNMATSDVSKSDVGLGSVENKKWTELYNSSISVSAGSTEEIDVDNLIGELYNWDAWASGEYVSKGYRSTGSYAYVKRQSGLGAAARLVLHNDDSSTHTFYYRIYAWQ